MKKRVKVRKSGAMKMCKSCRQHLLANKSKRQKKLNPRGKSPDSTSVKEIRRMLPGKCPKLKKQ